MQGSILPSRFALALGLACALTVFSVSAQEQESEPSALSPRNASYRIEVSLDPVQKSLEGSETLTWTNIQEQPTDELWFHLYWNAWRNNRSTWLLEDRIRGRSDRGDEIQADDWGYMDVHSIRLLPGSAYAGADLTSTMRYAAPDDQNSEDRTVMVVRLPAPVGPGESVQVDISWRGKIPRTFARTGFRGEFFFIAQWFPKLAVFEPEGWDVHQFHAATEFFSDYGVYDVSITIPESYVLGATGRVADITRNADETVTHRYRQADVHDFAWTASPDYQVREARFEEPGLPPVDMRLLIQPEHLDQVERHFAATRAALKYYGEWYGPYPYGHITIVDPAYGSGAGGMEYPTLFTSGTRLFNPFGGGSPESVTVHEAGHQFWYGIVGNNEFEHAWMDEGLNTFSTARTLDVVYGDRMLVRRYLSLPSQRSGFFPVMFEDLKLDRAVQGNRLDGYRPVATADAQSTPTHQYYPDSASAITYNKTALWLATLERYLGWNTLQEGMSRYFERFKFKHPNPRDFFDTLSEVAGQDLGWFFDQAYRSSEAFDYSIESVASFPVERKGYFDEDGKLVYSEPQGEVDLYRTEVVVRRNRGGVFPVEVLLVFEDGTEVRKSWDGEYRWTLFVEERPAKLDYAIVDPDRTLLLDLYYTNNSRRVESRAELPARKWASKWMVWLQDLLTTFAFFV